MKHRSILSALIALLALVTATPASAVVVFNTFGPGDSFPASGGTFVTGPSAALKQSPADQFMPTGSVFLTSVEVAVFNFRPCARFA